MDIWKLTTLVLVVLVIILGVYFVSHTSNPTVQNGVASIKNVVESGKENPNRYRSGEELADNNDYFYTQPTTIKFEQDMYDFDTIKQGAVLVKDLYYINTGKNPFFLIDVHVSCGCTIPHFDQKPIAPGEKGKVTIEYNSKGKEGFVMNKLTLSGNLGEKEFSTYFKLFVKK